MLSARCKSGSTSALALSAVQKSQPGHYLYCIWTVFALPSASQIQRLGGEWDRLGIFPDTMQFLYAAVESFELGVRLRVHWRAGNRCQRQQATHQHQTANKTFPHEASPSAYKWPAYGMALCRTSGHVIGKTRVARFDMPADWS